MSDTIGGPPLDLDNIYEKSLGNGIYIQPGGARYTKCLECGVVHGPGECICPPLPPHLQDTEEDWERTRIALGVVKHLCPHCGGDVFNGICQRCTASLKRSQIQVVVTKREENCE